MKSISGFLRTLFFGNARLDQPPFPAVQDHWLNVKSIWENKYYSDFGIERLIRLFLAVSLFAFPSLYIRHLTGKFGLLVRKIMVELYVLSKLILPLLFFYFGLTGNPFIALISAYMILETTIYLSSVIYLSQEYDGPLSYRRNFTTLVINYIQICLDFAVIYHFFSQFYDFFSARRSPAG